MYWMWINLNLLSTAMLIALWGYTKQQCFELNAKNNTATNVNTQMFLMFAGISNNQMVQFCGDDIILQVFGH